MDVPVPALKVLIVDDDHGLARLIEKAVRREGCTTAMASSGEQAIAWLKDEKADLMLLDLKLPDMHGKDLVDRLEAVDRAVPFVIITGQGDERVAVEMMKRGALDYLVKDVQFLDFVPLIVRRALDHVEKDRRLRTVEEALRREHLFGNAVLAASGAVMVVFDVEGRVVRTNDAFEKATGRTLAETRGRTVWELFEEPGGASSLPGLFKKIVSNPRMRETDGTLVDRHGVCRAMAWSVTALKDSHGVVNHVILSGLDITDRKRLQREVLEISELEKRRIGHDIHDGLGQVLTGVDMLIRVLQKRLAQTSSGDAHAVGNISTYVQDAIRQARMLAQGLSPVELQADGLMHGLRELAKQSSSLFKVDCEFLCESEVMVASHTKAVQIYRIAQEAISNAVKHGKARRISVTLELLSKPVGQAVLRVASDGERFPDVNPRAYEGMGLRTMRYRAEMIGAKLELLSGKEGGTEVVCKFSPGTTPFENGEAGQ